MPTPRRVLAVAIGAYVVFFSLYSVLRHWAYFTHAYDLGIFMQSLWTASHGEGFFFNTPEWEDIGTLSHFGVHNSPILIPLAVLYRLFPMAETLLVIQSIALALGALSLFVFARDIIGEKNALYLSLMYLANPLIQGINHFDFHPVSLAVPFIFLIPHYYQKGQLGKLALSSIAVLSVKEDAGLILIALGLLFVMREGFRSRVGKSLILVGSIWIVLSIFVVIPYFSGTYPYFSNPKLQRYGLELHPELALGFVIITFLSVAFLPLLKPRYLVPSLPLWAELLLSKKTTMLLVGFQYPYMLVPYLFIIAIYTMEDIEFDLSRGILGISLAAMLFFSPVFEVVDTQYTRGATAHTLLQVWVDNRGYFDALDYITAIASASNCPVATQGYLFPHMANRPNTYLLRTPFNSSYLPNGSIVILSRAFPDYGWSLRTIRERGNTSKYRLINVGDLLESCSGEYNLQSCLEGAIMQEIEECRVMTSR